RRVVLDGADAGRWCRSDDHVSPGHRHGGGGHRTCRSGSTQAGRRGARRLSHARTAGRLPAAHPDDRLPGDGAQVERRRARARCGAGRRGAAPRRTGPVAHPECPHRADEATGVWIGVSVRARRAGGIHPAGVSSGAASRRAILRARAVRVREGDREAARVVGGGSSPRTVGMTGGPSDQQRFGFGTDVIGVHRGEQGGEMRKLALAAVGAALVATAGCSVLGRAAFQNPIVHLRDVRVRGLGLTGGSLDVLLSVYNPNHFRLDATQLTYKVNLAGDSVTVASGALSDRFTVQDNDSTVVTIPVSFTYAGIGAAGRSILSTGAVDYHVLGDVTVGSPVGSVKVPYSSTGRFTTTGIAR